jgi:hypothetical protein
MVTEFVIGEETDEATVEPAKSRIPRTLRKHALLIVVVAGVLLGGALRYVPASSATPAGPNGAGSTACAATAK